MGNKRPALNFSFSHPPPPPGGLFLSHQSKPPSYIHTYLRTALVLAMPRGFVDDLPHDRRVFDRKVNYETTHEKFYAAPPTPSTQNWNATNKGFPVPSTLPLGVPLERLANDPEKQKFAELDRVWDENSSSWVPGTSRRRDFHTRNFASNWGNGALNPSCVGETFGYGEHPPSRSSRDIGNHEAFPKTTMVTALGSLGPRLDGTHAFEESASRLVPDPVTGEPALYRYPLLSEHAKEPYLASPKGKKGKGKAKAKPPPTAFPAGATRLSVSRAGDFPFSWAGTTMDKLVQDRSHNANTRGRYNRNASNVEDAMPGQLLGDKRFVTTSKSSSEEMLTLVNTARSKGMMELQKHGYGYPKKKRDDTQVSMGGPDFMYIPHVAVRDPHQNLV